MGCLYLDLAPGGKNAPPNLKDTPVQPGRVLPVVEVDGTPVRFVTTGETTRSGVPVLEVLGGRARGEA